MKKAPKCWLAHFVLFTIGCAGVARGEAPTQGVALMKLDGSDVRTIVSVPNRTFHGSPSMSHDGRWVAFDAYTENEELGRIFVANVETGEYKDLGFGARPDWSSDGKQLTFYMPTNRSGHQPGVMVMNPDGQARTWLRPGHTPRWSPDGGRLAYSRGPGGANTNLYLFDIVEETERKLMDKDWDSISGLSYSPDGRRLAFIGSRAGQPQRELAIVEFDDEQATVRSRYQGDIGYFPTWSPDGKSLATFERYNQRTSQSLIVLDADNEEPPRQLPRQDGYATCWDPNWTSDGEQIVFSFGVQ